MRIIVLLSALLVLTSCTGLKRAQTGLARKIAGEEVIRVNGYEVYCSEGKVCSEVDVLSIGMDDRDRGDVQVVFKNRTGNTAGFQVRLEIYGRDGKLLDSTRLENIAIPPTQEKHYKVGGLSRKDATVRVLMNALH